MSLMELRKELRDSGKDPTGKKSVLVLRLLSACTAATATIVNRDLSRSPKLGAERCSAAAARGQLPDKMELVGDGPEDEANAAILSPTSSQPSRQVTVAVLSSPTSPSAKPRRQPQMRPHMPGTTHKRKRRRRMRRNILTSTPPLAPCTWTRNLGTARGRLQQRRRKCAPWNCGSLGFCLSGIGARTASSIRLQVQWSSAGGREGHRACVWLLKHKTKLWPEVRCQQKSIPA